MDELLLLEEFHLAVFVPRSLDRVAASAVRRVLNRPAVRAALLRAVRVVLRRHRALDTVAVTLTR